MGDFAGHILEFIKNGTISEKDKHYGISLALEIWINFYLFSYLKYAMEENIASTSLCHVSEVPIMISQNSIWKLLVELCCLNRDVTPPSLLPCLPVQWLMHSNMHTIPIKILCISVNVAKLLTEGTKWYKNRMA